VTEKSTYTADARKVVPKLLKQRGEFIVIKKKKGEERKKESLSVKKRRVTYQIVGEKGNAGRASEDAGNPSDKKKAKIRRK